MEQPITFHRRREDAAPSDPHADDAAPASPARRALLAAMAGAAALAATGCKGPPVEPILPYVAMPEGMVPDEAVFYATCVVRDGAAFGVLVETHGGRPTKVDGNPRHPASLGATDAQTQASILQLWDTDRSRTVQRGDVAATPDALRRAVRERLPVLQANQGQGLHVLAGPCSSPTLVRQWRQLRDTLPHAVWHLHDPFPQTHAAAAWQRLTGIPCRVRHDLAGIRLLVCLDADPLDGAAGVRYAQDIARARAGSARPVLYAVQSSPSLVGSLADACRTLAPWQIDAMLEAVAARLGVPGTSEPSPDAATEPVVRELLALLTRHRDASVIIAGDTLSPRAHETVWALHRHLGSIGRGVVAMPAPDATHDTGTLADLVAAMRAGKVDTLLMLDANPVHDAPASGIIEVLPRVPLSVHLGLYRDETARLAAWHAPRPHAFEAWSDARADDGSLGIVQPVIAPLHDSVSPHALLGWLAEADVTPYQAVQATWRESWGEAFDARWREALRQGVIETDAPVPLTPPPDFAPRSAPASPPAGSMLRLLPSRVAGDFGNNAWLHELPHPHTRITWDNAALLSAATARELSVATGDVLTMHNDAGAVQAPVCIVTGQADGVIGLAAGYGRTAAGQVGNGVGANAHRLQPAASVALVPIIAVPSGERHSFARVQTELSSQGREPVRTLAPGGALPRPAPQASLYPPVAYPDHAWAMSIDLDACTGCGVCTVACQAENNIPVVGREEVERGRVMHWIRVDRYEDVDAFQPVPCMHCEHAPCEPVCPVGATVHDSEGLNAQVYNRCVGTRFCSQNCPYKVRRFNFLEYSADDVAQPAQRNPGVTVRSRGVMEKCTYCVQRISRARIESQRTGTPLRDGDVVTACQAACPSAAIVFGDLNDPASAVNQSRASPRHYVLLEELNTRPRTTYLARVRKPLDDEDGNA
jgi:molybdopterin-containing oxidoreductase family iron-sulfur binding subunit